MRGIAMLLLASALPTLGGLVFEFNGDLWHPIPEPKLLEKHGKETITIMADASTPMGSFTSLLEGIGAGSSAEKLKFQLRKQHRNALVTRDRMLSENAGELVDMRKVVFVTTGPRGTFLAQFKAGSAHEARYDQNLEGIQNFLNVAGECFAVPKGAGKEAVDTAAIIARSNCSFGQFLTVVQLLKQAGGQKMVFKVNDILPDPDFEVFVERDKKVKVPLARHAKRDRQSEKARIDLTIDDDAVPMSGEGGKLVDDAAVLKYFEKRKKEVEALGLNPQVILRTVEGLQFTHVRRVIRLAAKVGLNELIFVSLTLIEKERDQNMVLPNVDPKDAQPDVQPFFIKVDKGGAIFANVGTAQEQLDQPGSVALLESRMDIYAAAARVGNSEPLVQIYVEDGADQKRVVEILNVLAKYKIDKVTFTDLIEEE